MTQYAIAFMISLVTFSISAQATAENITIDPLIRSEVEKHIQELEEFNELGSLIQIYANPIIGDFYENDTLVFSNTDIDKRLPFKCFYFWRDGSLGINGSYGIFGGTGFYISIKNNRAQLYHMLSSDDFPTYAYNLKDPLVMRLEVACTETKMVLSEIPDATKKQMIYGYVEFKSLDYYSAGGASVAGTPPDRKKVRANLKIYFRSGYLAMD